MTRRPLALLVAALLVTACTGDGGNPKSRASASVESGESLESLAESEPAVGDPAEPEEMAESDGELEGPALEELPAEEVPPGEVPPAGVPTEEAQAPAHSEPAAPLAKPAPKPVAKPFLPIPAGAVQPEPCPPPARPPAPPGPRPKPRVPVVAESDVPPPLAVAARRPVLTALAGKGTWAVYFHGRGIDGQALVDAAKAAKLDSIWVRTGGTRQGAYYGDDVLRAVLIPAHRAGLKVIAWDFPFLSDPKADAYRAARALAFTQQGHRIDAFSPDIETSAEGVFITPRRVAYYLSLVRRAAGNRPIVTTVPRPTAKRLATYPYRAVADGSDALAPMVYWSCNEPGSAVTAAMDGLEPFGLPVHVIGQAYDMTAEGGRPGLPTAAETWRFIDVSRRRGALGVSLYKWNSTAAGQKRALTAYPWPR